MTISRAPLYCVAYLELLEQEEKLDEMATIPLSDPLSERLKDIVNDTIDEVPHIREFIKTFLEPSRKTHIDISSWVTELQNEFREIFHSNITIRVFGYSIILYIPVERTYPLPVTEIYSIIRCAATFSILLPNFEHLLRGGISLHWGSTFQNGDIYGPAYYEAYHLAHDVAEYPRILVSYKLIDYLTRCEAIDPLEFPVGVKRGYAATEKGFASVCKRYICSDIDQFYIDYLGYAIIYNYKEEGMYSLFSSIVKNNYSYIQREIARSIVKGDIDYIIKRAKLFKRLKYYYDIRRLIWDNDFLDQYYKFKSSLHKPINKETTIMHHIQTKNAICEDIHDGYLSYYCTVFIDFLGQKDKLKSMTALTAEEVTDEEFEQYKQMTFSAIESLRGTLSDFASGSQIGYQCFSDTVILYIPLADRYQSMLDQVRKLLYLLCSFVNYIPSFLADGLIIRGAIDINYGDIIVNGGQHELYGAAVRAACLLEGKAKTPRIIVSNNLLDYLRQISVNCEGSLDADAIRNGIKHCLANLVEDSDGETIVDYLGPYNNAFPIEYLEKITSDLIKALEFILSEEVKYRDIGNTNVADKYLYLREYINSRIHLFPLCNPASNPDKYVEE